MHEVLVKRLGDLSLPRKSVVRLTDRTDMTLDVYRGRKTTIYLLILPTPSRAFSAGDCASGCEKKRKDKRMTVRFIQDDRLKLLVR